VTTVTRRTVRKESVRGISVRDGGKDRASARKMSARDRMFVRNSRKTAPRDLDRKDRFGRRSVSTGARSVRSKGTLRRKGIRKAIPEISLVANGKPGRLTWFFLPPQSGGSIGRIPVSGLGVVCKPDALAFAFFLDGAKQRFVLLDFLGTGAENALRAFSRAA